MSCHESRAISHSPNHVFLGDTFCACALRWSQWTIWYPWKIFLWGGCKVGLISRRPNCLVFYSCFQRFFKLKLYIFNLKYWQSQFSWAKNFFFFFFSVIPLDSYLTFNTLIYSTVTTRNFLKNYTHFRNFFYQKIKFLPPKTPFSGIWIGLKIFLQVADIIIYSFCYLNSLISFICIF